MKEIKKERIRDRIKDNHLYKKTVKNRYLIIFIVLFTAAVTYNYFNGGFVYDVVNQDLQETTKFINSFGKNAWLFYILAIIFEVIVVPVPSLVLNVAASAHFGPLLTSVMTIIGSMIGAVIAYYAAKYFGHHHIDAMIGEKNKDKFHKYTEKYGHFVLFVLRVNPITSSDVFSYVAGLVAMPFWRFFFSTLLGTAPMLIIISYFGTDFLNNSPFFKLLFIIITSIYLIIFIYLILIFSKNKVKDEIKKIRKNHSLKK